ncbi:MAG TPA: hypothetical protein VKT32_17040 [Chthonomonadaceae bacterium]|nr:hypothetical protein [Chthonomonadaceae bacterium]
MELKGQEEKQAKKQFTRLIRRLGSADARVRMAAEKELWQMGPAGPARLRTYLERTRMERMLWPLLLLISGSLCWIATLTLIVVSEEYILTICFLFAASIILLVRLQEERSLLAKAFARFDDARNIPMLLECLNFTDGPARLAVSKALTRSLSYFTSEDASQIGPRQRERLCRLLTEATTEQSLAILKALERIGDKAALPYVQRLTTASDAALREAAEECLFSLQQSVEQQSIRQTLLRPSDAVEAKPETLLRPASKASEIVPQQLLRPQITTDCDG